MEVENKNALDLYSSALYGYQESVPTAVAANSRYKQIASIHSEDYGFSSNCSDACFQFHFGYQDAIGDGDAAIDTIAHSGKSGLKLLSDSAVAFRTIEADNDTLLDPQEKFYELKKGGCLPQFSPDEGNYLLSAWVRQGTACNAKNYDSSYVRVRFDGSSNHIEFYPSGPIIDGWQRIEGKFSIPHGATGIYTTLTSTAASVFFDDIRILPFHGSMKSYVYDPVSMRLDGNTGRE